VKNENEIKLKRAYWQGVYYSLNPEKRARSEKSEKEWLIASAWLAALDWSLGLAQDSATVLREVEDNKDWS
jgi:hypothetical protein